MTVKYTIKLNDAEAKALSAVAVIPQEWIENFVKERCRVVIDEIAAEEINRRLAAGETISGTKEDIVLAADVETAAERHERIEAMIAEQIKNGKV
jgi:hypothetical protein